MTRIALRALVVALAWRGVGCNKRVTDPPAPAAPEATPMTQPAWHRQTTSWLTFELPDPTRFEAGAAGEIQFAKGRVGAAFVNAWAGAGQDLDGWQARLVNRGPVLGPASDVSLCGRPARRQEAALTAASATGIRRTPSGELGHIEHRMAPQIAVAVAGTTAEGDPLLVTWTIDADQRQAARPDEERFFASLACPT
ncbi:MAG: hypothetical protein R3B06_15000 [Kofleriaceae bacterium]